MTISPGLLEELSNSSESLEPRLSTEKASSMDIPAVSYNEASFRWALNEDAMATEKLSEGIRKFGEDGVKLENDLKARLKK